MSTPLYVDTAELFELLASVQNEIVQLQQNYEPAERQHYTDEDRRGMRARYRVLRRLENRLADRLADATGQEPDRVWTGHDGARGCPECSRSFGPSYAGPCEHGEGVRS